MADARISLVDLVTNGTMSAEIAATLATAAAERRSILMIAIPRRAGKTTTMQAALDHAPAGTAIHRLRRSAPELGIPAEGDGGYLWLSEVADTGFDDYLWGAEVPRVFRALSRGFSLATALHAGGVDEAFEVICGENGVPDEDAARIDLAVYIHLIGDWRDPVARRIAEVREIEAVERGHPRGRTLFRWHEDGDRFETVERPVLIGSSTSGGVEGRVGEFGR